MFLKSFYFICIYIYIYYYTYINLHIYNLYLYIYIYIYIFICMTYIYLYVYIYILYIIYAYNIWHIYCISYTYTDINNKLIPRFKEELKNRLHIHLIYLTFLSYLSIPLRKPLFSFLFCLQ